MGLESVDQFDGAVMLQGQPVRQCANRRLHTLGEPAKRQQEQILLRLEARGARYGVSFPKELAKTIAELRESLVLRRGDFFCHAITISQCDICFHSSA